MATVLAPKGLMTRAIVTKFEVGDVVVCTTSDHGTSDPHPLAGDVGVIERIRIAEPRDGDETFAVFKVRFENFGGSFYVGVEEIAAVGSGDAWLWRQLRAIGGQS